MLGLTTGETRQAGCSGLQLYTFGQAVSIVFFTETWRPDSFYDKIKFNRSGDLHTLCLLGAY
jgi:diphthine methyl ester synthase